MKHYKNPENKVFAFYLDCFDENGQVINEIVEKIIEENSLIEISEEEAKELSKPIIDPLEVLIPSFAEQEQAEFEIRTINLLSELGVI